MPAQTQVGLIGIGLMGEVYAQRLIAAGFDIIGFDLDATKNAGLQQIGGRAVRRLYIAFPRMDITSDDPKVRQASVRE